MPDKEVELRFINIDASKIKKRLKELNAVVYQKRVKMSVIHYIHPKYKDYQIRIRDEGRNKTMTLKKDFKDKYPTEYEVTINDMEQGDKILQNLGCEIAFTNDKYREFWHMKGAKEIVFDELPGLPIFMEVDCHTEKNLFAICKKLGLNPKDAYHGDMYKELYGLDIKELKSKYNFKSLQFKTAKKVLGKHITKNKDMFNKILQKQMKKK